MKTVFCPLCKMPIKVVLKNETANEWKNCGKCGQPSYLIVTSEGKSAVKSLKEMIDENPKKTVISLFETLLRKKEMHIDDLIFMVGKQVEREIEKFYGLHVLDKKGYAYFIRPGLEKFIAEYIAPYAERKDILEKFLE